MEKGRIKRFFWFYGLLAVGVFSILFFPRIFPGYWTGLVFTAFLNVALVGGMNLLWGFGGYLHLGYMISFGLGAYGTALAMLQGLPRPAAPLLSLILGLPLVALTGLFLFRLTGLYFSAAGLGMLVMLEELVGKLGSLTGGHEGMTVASDPTGVLPFWGAWGLAALSLGLNRWFEGCKLGFQLRLIQEDEAIAQSLGVSLLSVKLQGYVWGAVVALLAGGMYVLHSGYISPASGFGLTAAVPPVIMALLGGGRKWWGPLWAAFFMTGLQELLWTWMARGELMVYGVVLLLLGIFKTGQGSPSNPKRK